MPTLAVRTTDRMRSPEAGTLLRSIIAEPDTTDRSRTEGWEDRYRWLVGWLAWLAERFFLLTGWQFVGAFPDEPKVVAVGYPHTTNWDFFVYLAVVRHFGLPVVFFAHRGLFVGPFGWVLRAMGGIPVQGESSGGSVVDQAVAQFASTEEMVLAIAPEGTRAADAEWHSGFWRVADAADVPVVMGFVDRRTKRMGLGPAKRIDGDPAAWMVVAREFYADKYGLRPERRGRLQLTRTT